MSADGIADATGHSMPKRGDVPTSYDEIAHNTVPAFAEVVGGIKPNDEIAAAKAAGRKVGICGQAPSDYPEFARFLVELGIDSISLNPDAVMKTTVTILEAEKARRR